MTVEPAAGVQTAGEFNAARQILALTDDELAIELGVTPAVIRAYGAGTARIPKRHAQMLAWRVAAEERQAALRESGLPECGWIKAYEDAPAPKDIDAQLRQLKEVEAHLTTCPVCTARQRYEADRFGPMPPLPETGWVRAFSWVDRLPSWARPAAVGAAILAAIVCVRFVFAVPALLRAPEKLGGLLIAIIAAAAAGAAGGFAYTLTRPTLRKLGVVGAYLTGIVCVFAYMGSLLIVAPVAFGETLVNERSDLVIFVIVSLFFGLIMGHSWFRGSEGM